VSKAKFNPRYYELKSIEILHKELTDLSTGGSFKLTKAISFSICILNTINVRRLDPVIRDEMASILALPLSDQDLSVYFVDFEAADGQPVTRLELLQWLRNRLVHFAEYEKKGVSVELEIHERVAGFRGFWVHGRHKDRNGRNFSGFLNREKLTNIVTFYVGLFQGFTSTKREYDCEDTTLKRLHIDALGSP
jgi:hypothetical protein